MAKSSRELKIQPMTGWLRNSLKLPIVKVINLAGSTFLKKHYRPAPTSIRKQKFYSPNYIPNGANDFFGLPF
jgi:hypothetical protein